MEKSRCKAGGNDKNSDISIGESNDSNISEKWKIKLLDENLFLLQQL